MKDVSTENFDLEKIDSILKSSYTKINPMASPAYKIDEGKQNYGVRKVWFEEALPLANNDTY